MGRRAAVSHARFRADAPPASAAPDGRRQEFRFVTEGIHAALRQAKDAAGGHDVRLGGGVATIRKYLCAALIDELYLAIAPVLLGAGEHLLEGIDLRVLGYECAGHVAGARAAAHVTLRRRA